MRQFQNVTVCIAVLAGALAAQTYDPPSRVGRLSYLSSQVSYRPADLDVWVEASLNRPLVAGDNLWVGQQGRAEIHVGSTALRLGQNTALQFLNLDDHALQMRLTEGGLHVRVRYLPQYQVFEIDTPNLAFNIQSPGDYRIGWDTNIAVSLNGAPRPDYFDEWCGSRNAREDRLQSVRYVSPEMTGYEDLDQYGGWSVQPGYGEVWMPWNVSTNWAPYQDGHWVWIDPWGWTWVDDAPWGFAPFHYGRWASFGNRWGWIPGPRNVNPVFAPALVAWVGGGTAAAVGWFPLGPREPYFPSSRVSQGYFTRINNSNTAFLNTTVINTYYESNRNWNGGAITNITYMNRNVRNGLTAVPRDSFARGRRAQENRGAPLPTQWNAAQVFATPMVAPQREGRLGPRADTSSRAARPPAAAFNRQVVARTAPPASALAPVPFERQQQLLVRTPGRPIPRPEMQQMRQAPAVPPVRVVDMGRVQRIHPGAPAGAPPQQQQQQERQAQVQQQQQRQQQERQAQIQQQQQRQQQERQAQIQQQQQRQQQERQAQIQQQQQRQQQERQAQIQQQQQRQQQERQAQVQQQQQRQQQERQAQVQQQQQRQQQERQAQIQQQQQRQQQERQAQIQQQQQRQQQERQAQLQQQQQRQLQERQAQIQQEQQRQQQERQAQIQQQQQRQQQERQAQVQQQQQRQQQERQAQIQQQQQRQQQERQAQVQQQQQRQQQERQVQQDRGKPPKPDKENNRKKNDKQ